MGNPKLEPKEHVAEEKESIKAIVVADVREGREGDRVDSFTLVRNTNTVTRGVTDIDCDKTTRDRAKVADR